MLHYVQTVWIVKQSSLSDLRPRRQNGRSTCLSVLVAGRVLRARKPADHLKGAGSLDVIQDKQQVIDELHNRSEIVLHTALDAAAAWWPAACSSDGIDFGCGGGFLRRRAVVQVLGNDHGANDRCNGSIKFQGRLHDKRNGSRSWTWSLGRDEVAPPEPVRGLHHEGLNKCCGPGSRSSDELAARPFPRLRTKVSLEPPNEFEMALSLREHFLSMLRHSTIGVYEDRNSDLILNWLN
ncbi:hypothetical protein ON010_g13525 [Phytophthora cinnamomi]|nr:hypothetical protein ON010_g13525 [Phytophthora cinnamomi]